jgi:hypothetical protein
LLAISGIHTEIFAQERCGTDEYMQKLMGTHTESKHDFEQWMQRHLKVKAQGTKGTTRTKENAFQIPVVVHIIHSGQDHPSNISDAQVFSQIKVLNEDYNRENIDASNTPSDFLPFAGNPGIEFVLAKRTPEGLPSNGIVRVQGPKTSWQVTDNYQIKSLSYWPAEHYLNIWVCNLTDYLGYAQFPQSNLVDGLENSSGNRLTDGVVITYTAFGSEDEEDFGLQNNYNKGRTTTHEIGHFLGLRHIWGDDQGGCGGDGDFVDDTPDQADRTLNCPSHPRSSCENTTMFQNFLDYTNDACMNLFTVGQVERMSVILQNSPRRSSLTTSPALEEPQPIANDLGIREISSPHPGECQGSTTPSVEVRNYGNNTITSATIHLKLNGAVIETKNFNLNLGVLASESVSFSPVSLSPGIFSFSFEIIEVNGNPDGAIQNNTLQRDVLIPESITTPIVESFDELPLSWQRLNPDGLQTWELRTAVNGQPGNKALRLNFYDYEDNEGEVDVFLSPVIDLTNAPAALLLFDVAHAQYQNSNDGLKVVILNDCKADPNSGETIYSKFGDQLATTAKINEPYAPLGAGDWRTEILNLGEYIGQSGIQIAFVGVNDWGNNLFLDNIRVITDDFANVTLKRIASPAPVVCDATIEPKVIVRNSGTAISSLDIRYTLNGTTNTHTVSGLSVGAGAEVELTLPEIALSDGTNSLQIELLNPDGGPDLDPADNAMQLTVEMNDNATGVPFRETFDGNFEQSWTILKPRGNPSWVRESFPDNDAVAYKGFENTVVGDEAWLVSPVFDLSDTEEASFFFDYSYAVRNENPDIFQVRAAKGCNAEFETIRTYSVTQLSSNISNDSWKPSTEEDWTRDNFVELNTLAGEHQVRLAFVIGNRNGNNFYVDNFRLYLATDANPVDVEGAFNVYPNPLRSGDFVSISYELPTLDDITLEITDRMGRQVYYARYSAILNQTDMINTTDLVNGLYIVRILTSSETFYTKFLIDR